LPIKKPGIYHPTSGRGPNADITFGLKYPHY
jgi:hypothetical protein